QRRRLPRDLQLGLKLADPPPRLRKLNTLHTRQARLLPAIDPVLLPPPIERRLAHPNLSGNPTDRTPSPQKLHNPPAKLRRVRTRHLTSPFPESPILTNRDQKTGTRSVMPARRTRRVANSMKNKT